MRRRAWSSGCGCCPQLYLSVGGGRVRISRNENSACPDKGHRGGWVLGDNSDNSNNVWPKMRLATFNFVNLPLSQARLIGSC